MKNSLSINSKILVVGTSGSGKSTLARNLSEKIGVPDESQGLFWPKKFGEGNLLLERDCFLTEASALWVLVLI